MRPKDVAKFLETVIDCPQAPAVFVWGGIGIGKSSVGRQVAKSKGVEFIDLRLSLLDPTDLRGIPIPEDGRAKWLSPIFLPVSGSGILMLDEINLAPPLVQSSAYQLVLDRQLGEYQLPVGWRIVAAGNPAGCGAHTYQMPAPLRSRFVHIQFQEQVDDWREWAMQNLIIPIVIEFISFRPNLLYAFDPKSSDQAFPSPRSWEFTSTLLKNSQGLPKPLVDELVDGTVGGAAASEFRAYCQIKATLPSLDAILAGENTIPEEMDITCALVTGLALRAEAKHYKRLLDYALLLPPEVGVLLIRLLAVKNKPAILAAANWSKCSRRFADVIL